MIHFDMCKYYIKIHKNFTEKTKKKFCIELIIYISIKITTNFKKLYFFKNQWLMINNEIIKTNKLFWFGKSNQILLVFNLTDFYNHPD